MISPFGSATKRIAKTMTTQKSLSISASGFISLISSRQCTIGQQSNTRFLRNRVYHTTNPFLADKVPITYVYPDGQERPVEAEIGMNLLDVAHANDIELEGACGGELACATCHLIFEEEVYGSLPEKVDEEDDMLDLAFELTDTSRLGCQIPASQILAGTKVKIPDDGY